MKRLFVALLMLVFIMGTTYCQSAEKATPKKAPKAKMEQMGGSQEYEEDKTTTSIQDEEDEPKAKEPHEEQEEEFQQRHLNRKLPTNNAAQPVNGKSGCAATYIIDHKMLWVFYDGTEDTIP